MNNCWWHHFLPGFDHRDEVFLFVPALESASMPRVVHRSDCSYGLGHIEFLYVEALRMWKDAFGCVVTLG